MHRNLVLLTVALIAVSCGSDTATEPASSAGGPHDLSDREALKGDDYISTTAREFVLEGVVHAKLPDGYDALDAAAQAARLEDAVSRRLTTVARSVDSTIKERLREASGGESGEDARYFAYFRRGNESFEESEVLADGRVRIQFTMELVGSYYLMSVLAPDEGGPRTFEVVIKDYWESEGETVTLEVTGSESRDAYPRYDLLFEDGVYDLGVHFGGDYNEGRHDIETAKWLVEALRDSGWENDEVQKFEELKIDSPPFVRTVTVEGVEVEARVYIYHSDMVEPDEEERDIVVYSGHAGEGAGFILDYQPRFEIRASELADIPMADKYQIFVLDGCRTYRTYVADIMANPAKSAENLDIVTTVNTTPFGAGYQLLHELVYWLTITAPDGSHYPLSWAELLRGINTRRFHDVHYGVHGIDSNPRLNPHGGHEKLCEPCRADKECGAGGNLCLGYSRGPSCGVACTTDTACGAGYRCARLSEDPELFYISKQCVRRDYVCPQHQR